MVSVFNPRRSYEAKMSENDDLASVGKNFRKQNYLDSEDEYRDLTKKLRTLNIAIQSNSQSIQNQPDDSELGTLAIECDSLTRERQRTEQRLSQLTRHLLLKQEWHKLKEKRNPVQLGSFLYTVLCQSRFMDKTLQIHNDVAAWTGMMYMCSNAWRLSQIPKGFLLLVPPVFMASKWSKEQGFFLRSLAEVAKWHVYYNVFMNPSYYPSEHLFWLQAISSVSMTCSILGFCFNITHYQQSK
jgi:hypothetical protein